MTTQNVKRYIFFIGIVCLTNQLYGKTTCKKIKLTTETEGIIQDDKPKGNVAIKRIECKDQESLQIIFISYPSKIRKYENNLLETEKYVIHCKTETLILLDCYIHKDHKLFYFSKQNCLWQYHQVQIYETFFRYDITGKCFRFYCLYNYFSKDFLHTCRKIRLFKIFEDYDQIVPLDHYDNYWMRVLIIMLNLVISNLYA